MSKNAAIVLSANILATKEKFLTICNDKCRVRTMSDADYDTYKLAFEEAQKRKASNMPFYEEQNTGGVTQAYFKKYRRYTTSAFWGVWIEPATMEIISHFGRQIIYGRNVKCARQNGVRTYVKDWLKHNPATVVPKQVGL